MRSSLPHARRGVTLIETLTVIFILSLVGVAIAIFQKDLVSFSGVISNSLIAQQDARRVLKSFAAEVRSASPSSLGAYPIAEATGNAFTFYSDINNDGLKEKIQYFLSGNTLQKRVTRPTGTPLSYNPTNDVTSTLATSVIATTTPLFSYYDKTYAGTSTPLASPVNITAIRLVTLTMVIDTGRARAPRPIVLTTQATIRNLKDNL